jgi:hypothetical protein
MSRAIGKVLKPKDIHVQTLRRFWKERLIPTTDSEQPGVDFAVRIPERR